MRILGIESSCDDTSVALIEVPSPQELRRASLENQKLNGDSVKFTVIAQKTASQVEVHKKYGGVVPEVAGRMHAENILPVIEEVMRDQKKPDAIAVTSGPGLITGLLVGVETAKSLSYLWNIPLIGVNHISGHVHSVQLSENNNIEFPALCLVVSGGHTELLKMSSHTEFELLGKTRDDAAGETFDKVGKLLGFDYPGGAKISKAAEGGNEKAIDFPRPMIQNGYEFSFAGLKTAALYWLRDNENFGMVDFCASFETAIVDVLTTKTLRAAKEFKPKTVILGGGVSANKKLRRELKTKLSEIDCKLLIPELKYTMDNAAMIAAAGYYKTQKKGYINWKDIEVDPNWTVYKK